MVITIKDTDYSVHFGIGFLRELDKKYFAESKSGVRFGMGMEVKMPMLLANDTITLAEFLYLGTCAEEKRPTQKEVDAYIDQAEDIEQLFKEVIDELKKHNATKLTVLKILTELAAEEEARTAAKEAMKRTLEKKN